MEKGFTSLVVNRSLRCVEALEVLLLRILPATLVRFDEARIAKEEQRLEEAWAIIAVLIRGGFSTELRKTGSKEGDASYSSQKMLGIDIRGHNVTTS